MKYKILFTTLIIIVIGCITTKNSFAQIIMQNNGLTNYWGSTDFTLTNPPQAIGIGNFIGTSNQPASALHINTNTVTVPFYGAGEVFRTDAPNILTLWRMYRNGTQKFNIQSTTSNTVDMGTTANEPLNFFTNSSTRMTILSTGNVGIGTTFPSQKFEVSGGHINIASNTTNGYMLGGDLYLANYGNNLNVFTGFNAGTGVSGNFNVCNGTFSGQNLTSLGHDNTFVGYGSGRPSTSQYNNSFFGSSTGAFVNASDNTLIGCYSGSGAINSENTAVGSQTFSHSLAGTASYNVVMGFESGKNTNNNNNTFVGFQSGVTNNSGSSNTLIGSNADVSLSNLSNSSSLGVNSIVGGNNATAIGANTSAPVANTLILGATGTNAVKVGIGLSGATGTNAPQNYLEINADPNNYTFTGTGGSGLRFRQLHASPSAGLNPGNGVLSVNTNGDVIYVSAGSTASGAFGNACGAATNFLTNNWEIPMVNGTGGSSNEWSLHFTGQSTKANSGNSVSVGIGIPCSTTLAAKLDVLNTTQTNSYAYYTNLIAGKFVNTGSCSSDATNTSFMGVYGSCNVNHVINSATNFGGDFYARNANINIGVRGMANISATTNYGVYASSGASTSSGYGVYAATNSNTGDGYGVYGTAGTSAKNNYGVYGYVNPCTNNGFAIYGSGGNGSCLSNNWAGYFRGNVNYTGTLSSTSDSIFKQNIQPIIGDTALAILSMLNPKTYNFDTLHYPSMNLSIGKQYGLIAQQVARVLPNLVANVTHPADYDSTGAIIHEAINYKALNYNAFIPILIAAVKQLNNHASSATNGVSINSSNQYEWGTTALTHTTELPMNGNSIYFSDSGKVNTNIGVGHYLTDTLIAKVDVVNNYSDATNQMAGKFINSGDGGGTHSPAIGVNGSSIVNNSRTNIGGDFSAYNADINIGVRGTISGASSADVGDQSGNDQVQPGGYAVYGDAQNSSNFWAGYFNGYVGTTCGWYQASDGKLKENVKNISIAQSHDIINQLKPSTYTFKADQQKAMNLPSGNQYGLIAEDVEKVMPELVRDMSVPAKLDKNGKVITAAQSFKGVNYVGMIPVLIAALQQTDSINKSLQQQINALQNCCGYNNKVPTNLGNSTSTELSDLGIILDQNAPNPFAEQTIITYTIPESVTDARLIFYTNNGTILKTVQITERGAGSITVYASNLSTGIYTYSLVADGKVADTKKMVCTKH